MIDHYEPTLNSSEELAYLLKNSATANDYLIQNS